MRTFLPPDVEDATGSSARAHFGLHHPDRCPCGRAHAMFLVTHGRRVLAFETDADSAMRALRAAIKLWIATHARTRTFVHAGVVAWGDQAVLVPGGSRTGKTTLVREMLRAGATYYSDDMAVLDRSGFVHPYPLPLGERNRVVDGFRYGRQTDVEPSSLDAAVGTDAARVAVVLLTQFVPGSTWRPLELTPARAAQAMMTHAVSARRQPARAMAAVAAACAQASSWHGPRGDAGPVIEFVLDRISRAELRPTSTRTR